MSHRVLQIVNPVFAALIGLLYVFIVGAPKLSGKSWMGRRSLSTYLLIQSLIHIIVAVNLVLLTIYFFLSDRACFIALGIGIGAGLVTKSKIYSLKRRSFKG